MEGKVIDISTKTIIDMRTDEGKVWSAQHPNTVVFVDDQIVRKVWYVEKDKDNVGLVYTYDVLGDALVHTTREDLVRQEDWIVTYEDGVGLYFKIVRGTIDLHQSSIITV